MRHIAIVMLIAAGCIDSSSVQCSFGLCPTGSQCDEDAKACIPAGCGNGVREGVEQCDGAVDPDRDCTNYGYYLPGGLACSRECTYDTSMCGGGLCGDQTTNGPELCDGLPPIGLTCPDFGFQIGRLQCSVDCSPSFQTCSSLGWQPSHGNAADELYAVWSTPNGSKLVAVGRNGHILEGNGVVWSEVESPTTKDLNGVWGVNRDNIYAVGAGGTIIHYNGTKWVLMTSPTTQDLNAISGTLVDPTGTTPADMWAVGAAGTILHAMSSNASWAAETSNVAVNLHGVWADGVATPVAVGEAATMGAASPTALYRNAGTWTPMATPSVQVGAGTTVSLDAVWGQDQGFVAVGTVTTASNHGIVLQANLASSTNWVFTGQSIATTDLKSVWGFVSQNRADIYIGGQFGALIHYDGITGPNHFYAYNSNTTRGIHGLWGLNPAFVRAATLGGEVQEYNGTDLQRSDLALLDPGLAFHNMNAVWADPASQNVIAVGDAGRVVQHTNFGWSTPAAINGTAGPWNAVWGSGSTVFVAGGNASQGLAVSGNGGTSYAVSVLTTVNWQALWGTSATNVYAVGSAGGTTGALAHYNGAWTQLADVGTKRLNGIWGSSDSDIFVVGNAGTIAHSTTSGASWTPQVSGVGIQLNAVWGTSPTNVWAVGASGTILRYDGTSWRRMTSTTAQDLYAIGGTADNDVFAAGRGTLLHWNGTQWVAMSPELEDIYGMAIQRGASYFAGAVVAGPGAIDGGVLAFGRTPNPTINNVTVEAFCSDPWDNDGDGLVDCQDPDCACAAAVCTDTEFKGCSLGGACSPTTPITCGETTVDASTYTGVGRIDDLPCLDHATPGPEASYRLTADHDGQITVTLDDPSGMLDLVELDPFDGSSVTDHRRIACDVSHCTAAAAATGTRTLTIAAKGGETYYVLVDGPANTAEPFTLSVDCP